jgi:hypothetical protein
MVARFIESHARRKASERATLYLIAARRGCDGLPSRSS